MVKSVAFCGDRQEKSREDDSSSVANSSEESTVGELSSSVSDSCASVLRSVCFFCLFVVKSFCSLVPLGGSRCKVENELASVSSTSTDEEINTLLERVSKRLDALKEASATVKLRDTTKENLHMLHKYLDSRAKMDEKCNEVDESQTIANFPLAIDSGGIETESDDPFEFKPEFQQQSTQGKLVETLDELYTAAKIAKPAYQEILQSIVGKVCESCSCSKDEIHILSAPLKGSERAQEKAVDDYSKRKPGPGVSWLYDIVRASISFSTAEQIARCLEVIRDDPTIRVVKAKNRFQKPTLTGYRDFNLCIQIDVPSHGFKHICELQIHHKTIKALDTELRTHLYYEYFRKYFAGNTGTLEERLNDLKLINEGGELDDKSLNELLEKSNDEDRLMRLGDLFESQLCEYDVALRVYIHLLELQQKTHGEDHLSVANTYDKLATILYEQGKFDESISMYNRALDIKKRNVGETDSSILETYNGIATVLKDQGNLDGALEILNAEQTNLGEDPLSAITTYNNMAIVLQKQGKLRPAMAMYQLSLDIGKKNLGESHLYVANTLNGMANVLQDLGMLDDAIAAYRESLEIRTKNLGKDHSYVAETYNNMGNALYLQGDLDQATTMYEDSLDIKKRNRGEHHASVANTYNNKAVLLQDEGEPEEAMEMYRLSLSVYKVALGEYHPSFSTAFENALGSLEWQCVYGELLLTLLLDTFELLIEIQSTILGEKHPLIAETCRYMGDELLQSDHPLSALTMYKRSLEIYVATLGKEHWEVGIACLKIANVLEGHVDMIGMSVQDRFELHYNALEASLEILGEGHWHFLDCYSKFQTFAERQYIHLAKLGQKEEAILLLCLADTLESSIPKHAQSPRMLSSLAWEAEILSDLYFEGYAMTWRRYNASEKSQKNDGI